MESLGECAAGELGGDPVGEGALPLHSRDVPGPQVEGENHASLTEPGDRVESLASHRRSFDCRLVPPVKSGSETFASKALRELLRPANLPLPLGELRVRGDAFVSVLHPSILGMDILKQFKMELNFDDGLLKIGEFVPAEKGWEKIPVTIYEGRPYVECAIGEIEGTFLIDSGSNTEIRFPESEFEYLVNDSTIQMIENQ